MQRRMIGIYLDPSVRAALTEDAQRARRAIRDQAAVLICEKLIERGYLPADTSVVQPTKSVQAAGNVGGN